VDTSTSERALGTTQRDGGPPSAAEARLQEQIGWYDDKSRQNRLWFKALKICQIVIAAAIPFGASISAPVWVIGGGGAAIVVLESLQQLQQYQQHWTTYRATCEQLKHEKFLFLAHAGPYGTAADPQALLAERVESLVSQEHAAWVSHQEESGRKSGGEG
jgi:hypothetical protein